MVRLIIIMVARGGIGLQRSLEAAMADSTWYIDQASLKWSVLSLWRRRHWRLQRSLEAAMAAKTQ